MKNPAKDDRPARVAEYDRYPVTHMTRFGSAAAVVEAPPDARSVKRGHRIPNGNRQRAGEITGADFRMLAIELAYKAG